MKKIFLIFIFSFILFGTYGQKKSLLWEISGNGLEESSYLFGTIHIIPSSDFFFYDNWTNKLKSCKYLVLETSLELNIFKQLSLVKKMKLPKDSTLSDFMSVTESEAYQSYMLDSLDISLQTYKFSLIYKPFFTYSLILNEVIKEKKEFYEQFLSDFAKKNHIKIHSLESIDFQMSLVEDIPIKKQIDMFLFDFDKEEQNSVTNEFYKLVEDYKQQDLNKIMLEENNSEEKDFNEIFISNRNKNWVHQIIEFIKKKSTFVAVGAGHLPGENGLIKLLENEGYILTPISGI